MFDENIWSAVLRGASLAVLALFWLIILIRVNGLRSLSKMTNFDFVATVAFGSLLASAGQVTSWNAFAQALAALTGLFFAQFAIAAVRRRSEATESSIANTPVLLMRDGEIFEDALQANNVTRSDLIAKLREANVLDLGKVRAVVLEETGDVSVLHGTSLDWSLCEGVEGAPKSRRLKG
ncbi:hypothetical protein BPTFM16_01784 [Altererythrobacter insulae]|nr:hypothetical protein BPTFM16_01784 [Altererythrobacter insulae]